ncbi:MerC domain-containing protein [Candidatus Poribacteria bacterium]|nr:MerC domain-containing protein [Candidatus Poribacteria bacterium]
MKHLDKLGIVGSLIAALCCLGVPAVLSIFTAIGLGFLINDAILLPLLALFLLITLVGLFAGYRSHLRKAALIVGLVSAVVMFLFLFIFSPITYIGLVGLIAASVLNVWHQRTRETQA